MLQLPHSTRLPGQRSEENMCGLLTEDHVGKVSSGQPEITTIGHTLQTSTGCTSQCQDQGHQQ